MGKVCRKGNIKRYHFFLFNDAVIYCSVGFFGKYDIHCCIPLRTCRINDLDDDSEYKDKNAFEVYIYIYIYD